MTKKEVVQKKIDACIEDIYAMEIVRDFNKFKNQEVEVKAAIQRIMQNQENLEFLEKYIKSL